MTGEKIRKMTLRGPSRVASVLALLTVMAACDTPRFQGPQIQGITPGFLRNPEVTRDKIMFPDREKVHFDAWVKTNVGDFSGIYITGHPGVTSQAEVEEARERSMAVPTPRKMRYGEIEVGEIDGRTALAWMEVWEDNGLREVTFRSVIPYDSITYVVEFLTGDPIFKSRPDSMRAIVATFAIGETEWNMLLIALAVALSLLVFKGVGSRLTSSPYSSSENYSLPTFSVEEEERDSGGRASAPAGHPGPPEGSGRT